ncbi:hypothetical protein ACLB2K_062589 [Fragaria x ananassa]
MVDSRFERLAISALMHGFLHLVVILTGIIDEYAEASKTVEALYVYRMTVQSIVLLMLTLAVIIMALAADPHSNFHGIAKEFVMEKRGRECSPILALTSLCLRRL